MGSHQRWLAQSDEFCIQPALFVGTGHGWCLDTGYLCFGLDDRLFCRLLSDPACA